MTPTTDATILKLIEMEKKATEGPWVYGYPDNSGKIDLKERHFDFTITGKVPTYGERSALYKVQRMFADRETLESTAELIIEFRNHARSILEELRASREALRCIASAHRPRHDTEEYWIKISHENCATVLATDTKIARAHLEKFVKEEK